VFHACKCFYEWSDKDGEGFPLSIVDYGVGISENKVGSGGGGARSG
jgi:hypothetical protein